VTYISVNYRGSMYLLFYLWMFVLLYLSFAYYFGIETIVAVSDTFYAQ
jgi:hypothetical protein